MRWWICVAWTLFVAIVAQRFEDARASGNTALSSPCWVQLATMVRVVNYHSNELVTAGFPGFSAGRGFDPAGGAPGGG
ncbi:hypothetical protein F511_38395 [Dorcoceras hygrometricum]|uniref:Uncharacterized protein n=1 Tax=Dorcoceras hygrometricum TaxID=472368 RepID=A0A2Z7AYQ1_9LAMI|nr:hypothetical protein F511_38395 [Dorcoceras hygrometricum]